MLLKYWEYRAVFRIITGRLKDPNYRGMNYWHDMLDWLGGYPFEVAKPEMVVRSLLKIILSYCA